MRWHRRHTAGSSVGQGNDWLPPLAPTHRKEFLDTDQDQLEELCCDLTKKALLSSPGCQLSIGLLGKMHQISSILQQMPSCQGRLSKILQERPETFVLFGAQSAELTVSLSQQALAFARLEESSALMLASDFQSTAVTQHASSLQEQTALLEEPVMNNSQSGAPCQSMIEWLSVPVDMGSERVVHAKTPSEPIEVEASNTGVLGDDEFEEGLRQSLVISNVRDAREALQQAIQTSYYKQASNHVVDDRDVAFGQRRAASATSESTCIASKGRA